ncbi:MAG: hypothetical protein GY942_20110 [Aestuariibacter sp.]|nr:hypothetical protein [Aestuariibacter sp.]
MSYYPEPAPTDPKQLAEYIERELRRIGGEIDAVHDRNILYAEPSRVSDGMVRIADGSSWNPGSGGGQYLRLNDEWHYMGSGGDTFLNISLGLESGYKMFGGLGERESMGVVTDGEDIWRGNQLTPAPTSDTSIPVPPDIGEQMTVISEDANDTSAGTGVRTVDIHYLDATGAEQEETVTLNGTTGVDTVATDIRFVNDMHSATAGSNGVAEGHIKIYAKSDSGLVYNMIEEGGNKSLVPNRMVPLGKTLVLQQWRVTETKAKRVAFRIRSTDNEGTLTPGVFCFKDTHYLSGNSSGDISLVDAIPALSIVKVSGWGDANGGESSCSWWGILKDD